MTNAEQFLVHYGAIELYLRRTYGSKNQYDTFYQLIKKAEKYHSVIAFYADDLREYGELRNAIIHKRSPDKNIKIIAEPHSFVVDRMSHIRNMVERPLKVKDVMVKPVKKATINDSIYKTALSMYENIYTHIPVYKGDEFKGVFSESSLLRWIGYKVKNNISLDINNTINEMIDFLDQSGNKFNDLEFIASSMLILDVKNRFDVALHQGRRLGVIFVTRTGKKTEPIKGLITAWDLPKLTLK